MAIRRSLIFLSFSCFFLPITTSGSQTDTLQQGSGLKDWNRLVSKDGKFTLGFFDVGTSQRHYLGIWYTNQAQLKVWVANRGRPISDCSGNLTIDDDGQLKIIYSGGIINVSNHIQIARNATASAILGNDGNFILREQVSNGTERVSWQSFDHPTSTLLPGMRLGVDLRSGHKWNLTSFLSRTVPAAGSFTLGADFNRSRCGGGGQLIIWRRGEVHWSSGCWHSENSTFGNIPMKMRQSKTESEMYFTHYTENPTAIDDLEQVFSVVALTPLGFLKTSDGLYATCRIGEEGPDCVKHKLPICRTASQHFVGSRLDFVGRHCFKVGNDNMSRDDCEVMCWKKCSCVAYAASNFEDETGCQIWQKQSPRNRNQYDSCSLGMSAAIYVLQTRKARRRPMWRMWVIISVGGPALIILLSCSCYLGWKKLKLQEENRRQRQLLFELGAVTKPFIQYDTSKKVKKNRRKTSELQFFSFRSIVAATDDFSAENKLGEGGFGPVYKGKLLDKQEIAIKRLSRSSNQGLQEFKNEIALIAKLQHNNLVKLLGCCIEGKEKILIYEYLQNRSLNFFLFDPSKKHLLDWNKRFNIIEGIAQGVLYLHKHSRFKVIHRDLKASNILLDNEMNPKISDFGMARIFGQNELEASTNKIVGTYGYMSPEYAMEGIFSTKSDVFSFGVLLLEIVSGKKNYDSYRYNRQRNLIGHAWELWKEGRGIELIDETLRHSSPSNTVTRCINVGLLCVQENPTDRPTMTEVISMLSNENMQLSTPKQPAFFTGRRTQEAIWRSKSENYSLNNVTISTMDASLDDLDFVANRSYLWDADEFESLERRSLVGKTIDLAHSTIWKRETQEMMLRYGISI